MFHLTMAMESYSVNMDISKLKRAHWTVLQSDVHLHMLQNQSHALALAPPTYGNHRTDGTGAVVQSLPSLPGSLSTCFGEWTSALQCLLIG
jgi:hypothetical protein